MSKKIIFMVLAVAVIGAVLAMSVKTRLQKFPAQKSAETVKIGGLFGLTGYVSFAGEASRDGFLMAIEDAGTPTEYVIEDFQSESKNAVIAASKLIGADKVLAIIGPEWVEFGEVITPIANEKKMLFISPWMVSEATWSHSPYYFSATPSERSRHRKLLAYMAKQGVKRMVIVYSNNAWSLDNIGIFKDELAHRGEDMVILQEFKFAQDATDYRTDIAKIKQLKPDAIYSVIATDESHGIFAKQLQELGAKFPIYLDNSRAESPVTRDRFLPHVLGSIYPAPRPYKNEGAFLEKYEKRFGRKPGALSAATAYDMTALVLKAVKSGAKNTEDIRIYLAGVKNYEGYSNTITFNEYGQVASEEVVIKRITKDGFEILE